MSDSKLGLPTSAIVETAANQTESIASMAAKISPPASVAVASIYGMPISELLMWLTLIYTVLMILHKVFWIWKDTKSHFGKLSDSSRMVD